MWFLPFKELQRVALFGSLPVTGVLLFVFHCARQGCAQPRGRSRSPSVLILSPQQNPQEQASHHTPVEPQSVLAVVSALSRRLPRRRGEATWRGPGCVGSRGTAASSAGLLIAQNLQPIFSLLNCLKNFMNECFETSLSHASFPFPVQAGCKVRVGWWERICSFRGSNTSERQKGRYVSWLMLWDVGWRPRTFPISLTVPLAVFHSPPHVI